MGFKFKSGVVLFWYIGTQLLYKIIKIDLVTIECLWPFMRTTLCRI